MVSATPAYSKLIKIKTCRNFKFFSFTITENIFHISAKLSSSGSDSEKNESEEQQSYQIPVDPSQAYTYDENAQDYTYGESTTRVIEEMDTQQFNDEDSFDPGQFFTSFPQQEQENVGYQEDYQEVSVTNNIHQDLQVSESESESDDGGFEAVGDEQQFWMSTTHE